MKHLLNGGIKSFPFHHSAALFEIGENEARRKAIEWIQATRVIAKASMKPHTYNINKGKEGHQRVFTTEPAVVVTLP